MASTCPICDSRTHRKTIEILAEEGADLSTVKAALQDLGISTSNYWVKKHFKEHTRIDPEKLHPSIVNIAPSKKEREAKVADEARRKEEVKEYLDEIAMIDLDKVLDRMGIDKRVSSMGEVLTIVQKMSLGLHIAAGAVAYDRMERYMRDPEGRRYPNTELRGAKMTAEMVGMAFGVQQAASLQTAADTLEKAGYRVVADEIATLPSEVARGEDLR